MAAVAVFMMIMVAFAPMASIFTDDQGSDATPTAKTLTGFVKDKNGAGISGITVTITGAEGFTLPSPATNVTNADGKYTFTLSGNGPATTDAVVTPTGGDYTFGSTTQTFAKDSIGTGIDVVLGDSTIIADQYTGKGKVTDASGTGIPGITPTVALAQKTAAATGLETTKVFASGDNGEFKFLYKIASMDDTGVITFTVKGVNAGGYTFKTTSASDDGWVDTDSTAGSGGSAAKNINLTATPIKANERTFTVLVKDAVGNALSSITPVVTYALSKANSATVTTSVQSATAAGTYKVSYLITDVSAGSPASGDKVTFNVNAGSPGYTFSQKTTVSTRDASSWGNVDPGSVTLSAGQNAVAITANLSAFGSGNLVTISVFNDGAFMTSVTGDSASSILIGTYPLTVGDEISIKAVDATGEYVFTGGAGQTVEASTAALTFSLTGTTSVKEITGTIKDSSATAQGIKATITYTVETPSDATAAETKTVESDASGNYKIKVVSGSTVAITGVAATGYTFPVQAVNIGKVTGNINATSFTQLAFKANEKTATGTLSYLAGPSDKSLMDGITATATWYLETDTAATGSAARTVVYTTAATGTASIASVAKDGTFKVSYTTPDALPAVSGVTYKFFLLVSAVGAGSFTFETESPVNGATQWTPTSNIGTTWTQSTSMTSGVGTFTTVQKVTAVTIQNSASVSIPGVSATASWFSGKIGSTTYVSTGATASIVTSASGLTYVVYSIQANTGAARDYALQVSGTAANGYTFDTTWTIDESFTLTKGNGINYATGNQAAGTTASPTKAFPTFSALTIQAKETTVAISGTVASGVTGLAKVAVNYTTGNGNSTVYTSSTGAYTISVAYGTTVSNVAVDVKTEKYADPTDVTKTINNPALNFTFQPIEYNLGVVKESKTDCNFAVYTSTVSKVIDVTGLSAYDNVAVTLAYTDSVTGAVSGTITKQSGHAVAIAFKIDNVPTTTVLSYTLTIAGYEVELSGTSFTVQKNVALNLITYADGVPASADLMYVIDGASTVTSGLIVSGTVKTGADGKATVNVPVGSTVAFYQNDLTVATIGSKTITEVAAGSAGTLKMSVAATIASPATVNIAYVSFNDVRNVFGSAVASVSSGSYDLVTKDIDGYKFVGWYIDGSLVSSEKTYSLATEAGATYDVDAVYSQNAPSAGGIDSTTLIIGIVAVVLALVGVALVFIGKKN